jgi:hypothetical protein
MSDRLAALEAQAAALAAEIAALKAGRTAPPPPVKDVREVSVTVVLDERGDGPSLKEMEKLFAVVKALAPWPEALRDRYDDSRPFRAFSSCFRWLANKGRTEFPNPKFALGFWLDDARAWLRARNSVASDLDANALILAVYAQGDIGFCPARPELGHTWELALAEHAGRSADVAGWRRILAGGAAAVRPPSSPARRLPMASSQVRVYGG